MGGRKQRESQLSKAVGFILPQLGSVSIPQAIQQTAADSLIFAAYEDGGKVQRGLPLH